MIKCKYRSIYEKDDKIGILCSHPKFREQKRITCELVCKECPEKPSFLKWILRKG